MRLVVETTDTDLSLIRRIIGGDADALGELYDRHARRVFSLACRIVTREADAEDVTQEVFTQVWRQARRFEAGRGSFAAWLLVITRSRALDRVRAQRARPDDCQTLDERALTDLASDGPDSERQLLETADAERLRAALRELPASERESIELAYYAGLTQSEIAARLRQPLGTVKTRVRSGLNRLRTALEGTRP